MTGYYDQITNLGLLQSGPDLKWGWTSIHPHAVYFCFCVCRTATRGSSTNTSCGLIWAFT